jgi:acetolactate synthase-1/2/3 large subunit
MNGAEALVQTLAGCGVTHCFANPGTSEMHLVTALDREPRIRSTLCLFEGVATGAADGFARMSGKPAMTLLHLGPGYLNGGANIHNARRAFSPMINVIGDHATYHRAHDAPLSSDIAALVRPNSLWVGSADQASDAGAFAAEAYGASLSPPGGPVSLILPADTAWLDGGRIAQPIAPAPLRCVSPERVRAAAAKIRSVKKPLLLAGHSLLNAAGLAVLARLQAAGVRVMHDTFVARQARGAGRFAPARMQYFAEAAVSDMAGVDLMVLAGGVEPVAFFAYPNRASVLTPETALVITLAHRGEDALAGVEMLADELGAPASGPAAAFEMPDAAPAGALTPASIGVSIARHLPEEAIVSDDGVTASIGAWLPTQTARPHDWLYLTGGAIGQGLPLAVGAASACTDRKVICLSGDGAGMYTVQALWTMARAHLPVVTIVFRNDSYRILNIEMHRTGAGNPGPAASAMLSLGDPSIDWVKLAQAQGVEGVRATTAEAFDSVFARAVAANHPILIEAVVAQ